MEDLIIKKINPKAGEEVVVVVRHFGLTFWPKILAVFLLLILPFFFIFPLFKWGYWGVVLFLFPIILGIIYAVQTFVSWYYNAFIITNCRVVDIDQRGFFERIVSEAVYEKIQDVSYRRKGIWQTIFRYGDVRIAAAGTDIGLEIKNVRSPESVQQLIADLSHLEKRRPDGMLDLRVPPPNAEQFNIIKKSIEDLDEKQLEELDGLVRNKLRQIKLKKLEQLKNFNRDNFRGVDAGGKN
ncbi:PH domain-containing protein [Candidatus Falkowbacteria bacterium]|nr:PH domain-containing protein [Candidatus Falkowbacteria bacterium]